MAKKYGSIQHIYKSIVDLETENDVFLEGQFVIAIAGPNRLGLKCGDGVKTFMALAWMINPSIELPIPPFKIRNTDPQYAEEVNADSFTDVVITDERLFDRSDYVVMATEVGEFRDSMLEYDPILGNVRIKNWNLTNGNHVTIFPTWTNEVSDAFEADLTEIKKKLAIFAPGSAIFMWRRPANEIPLGFSEVTDFRGKFIVGYHPTEVEFNQIGKTGGAKDKILSVAELPPINFQYTAPGPYGSHPGGSSGYNRPNLTQEKVTNTIGNGQKFSLLNPYRTVNFIEYTG